MLHNCFHLNRIPFWPKANSGQKPGLYPFNAIYKCGSGLCLSRTGNHLIVLLILVLVLEFTPEYLLVFELRP